MVAITHSEDESLLDEVVQYITRIHCMRRARSVTLNKLVCDPDSPLWRRGGLAVVQEFVSRHASRLALADTGRSHEGSLEVLLVSFRCSSR